jgi:hypothetical protein
MKKTIVKIFFFCVLLLLAFFLSNEIYIHTFYKEDLIETDAKMLLDIDSIRNVNQVIYFGESSNFTTGNTDSIKKSISELIAEQLKDQTLGTIQHAAVHARTYLELIKNIRPGSAVRTLIVTMNLRSFDADWINSRLETPLMRSNVMYAQVPPIIKKLMISFSAYDDKIEYIRDKDRAWHWKHDAINVPADFKYKNVTEWDADVFSKLFDNPPLRDLTCAYIKTYAFSIDTFTNPRIKDFDEIVKVAKENKLNLVFNLLAENVQYADSLVGPELVSLIKQNRDLLVKRYNKDGVIVVDNLELIDGKDFLDQDWTSEHYNQTGRIAIANHVLKAAAEYLH